MCYSVSTCHRCQHGNTLDAELTCWYCAWLIDGVPPPPDPAKCAACSAYTSSSRLAVHSHRAAVIQACGDWQQLAAASSTRSPASVIRLHRCQHAITLDAELTCWYCALLRDGVPPPPDPATRAACSAYTSSSPLAVQADRVAVI